VSVDLATIIGPTVGVVTPLRPYGIASSEPGTNKPVKVRFWPWLEPFSARTSLKPLRLYLNEGAIRDAEIRVVAVDHAAEGHGSGPPHAPLARNLLENRKVNRIANKHQMLTYSLTKGGCLDQIYITIVKFEPGN